MRRRWARAMLRKCGWKAAPEYRHAATRVTGMRVPGGGITARRWAGGGWVPAPRPVGEGNGSDTKGPPCRLSTVTAQGNALQSVVVVLPLGSVITTRIFVAPGTPGRFAPMYNDSPALGCTPPTRFPGHEDRPDHPKNCPNHFHGVPPFVGGPPEIMYCPSSMPVRYIPSGTHSVDPLGHVPGFPHIALYSVSANAFRAGSRL